MPAAAAACAPQVIQAGSWVESPLQPLPSAAIETR